MGSPGPGKLPRPEARVTDESTAVSQNSAFGWRERALTLRQEGKLGEAVDACRRALKEAPADAQALSELAHALRLQGSLEEARSAASRAVEIAPGLASAWFNLGAVRVAQGETARGIESYRKALELDPSMAEAWSNLGGALGASGDKAGEIEAYQRAIRINPRLAPVWSNLGHALRLSGQIREAVAACRKAVQVDPAFAPAWINLGTALVDSGEHEAAITACESALRLQPGLAQSWGALGGALHAARRLEEALQAHRRAVELQPDNATFQFNLGVTLQHCGRSAEAIPPLRRALEVEPVHAEAHFELGLALLVTGQLREGWHEYEWRWRRPGVEPKRYDLPLWGGDRSESRRLLLWGEQGIGDQVIYGSMIPDLLSSPLRLTLEVDRRLVPIYRRSFPQVSVVPRPASPAAGAGTHDWQAPLASLGGWLRPSFESFPGRAFLEPDPARVSEYRRRLAGGRKAVVGVSWRSANQELGSFKSTRLGDWAGIVGLPGILPVDLQYGDTASERESLEREARVRIEHLPDLDLTEDLDALAALCAACDLVITVSNVTAHIAGAIGRPVWLIAPKGNGRFWYWFTGRGDSPWYRSMRVFSQHTPGSWGQVLESVEEQLATFTKPR